MRGRNDVIIGIAATAATMAVGLAVVPIFVRLLGVEAYGLVGFLALLQASLQLLDMGLAPAISREVARTGTSGSHAAVAPLLRTVARAYIGVGLVVGAAIWLLSPILAMRWLHPAAMQVSQVTTCVAIMGFILACRWPVGVYSGALIGARRVRSVSLANLLFASLSQGCGALVVIALPRVEALFVWQALVALVQLLTFRAMMWRSLALSPRGAFTLGSLRTVWRFSAGMSVLTLLAVLLSQLDRLIVSKLVSLEAFGVYALASVVGRALYGLINPVYNVIYPRFTALVEHGNGHVLETRYGEWTALFCTFFFPASMFVIVAARPLLTLWTGNPALAVQAAPMVSLIALGSALHGAMYFPFAAQVAHGDSRTPVLINLLLVAFYVPLLLALVRWRGVEGAALAWCALFLLYLPVGTWITHRTLMRSIAARWLLADVGLTIAITASAALLVAPLVARWANRPPLAFLAAGIACAAAAAASAAVTMLRYPSTRSHLAVLDAAVAKLKRI